MVDEGRLAGAKVVREVTDVGFLVTVVGEDVIVVFVVVVFFNVEPADSVLLATVLVAGIFK